MLVTLADRQLAAWQEIAEKWIPWLRLDGAVMRCPVDGLGVVLVMDSRNRAYRLAHEQWVALTVLHLRNHHQDLDPDPVPDGL